MKKLILTVALIVASSYSYSQSGGLGGAPGVPGVNDMNTATPSGNGYGGGLGGATSPGNFGGALGGATSTTPAGTDPTNMSGTIGTTPDQQRMEDRTNFAGGSLGAGGSTTSPTSTPAPATNIPLGTPTSDFNSPVTQPQTTPLNPQSGFGTGAPSNPSNSNP